MRGSKFTCIIIHSISYSYNTQKSTEHLLNFGPPLIDRAIITSTRIGVSCNHYLNTSLKDIHWVNIDMHLAKPQMRPNHL